MKIKALLPLVLIACVIMVSGCTGGEEKNTYANDGIVITEFSVDPVRINDDETSTFYLEFENIGGTTATAITANLYGLEGWGTRPAEKAFSRCTSGLLRQ